MRKNKTLIEFKDAQACSEDYLQANSKSSTVLDTSSNVAVAILVTDGQSKCFVE